MIHCRNVTFSYGAKPFFKDFTLSFESRRFTALLGPNGSGKTTLLKLLLGLRQPQKGELIHAEKDLSLLPSNQRAALLSYVPQSMERTFDFTVEETVGMGRYSHRKEWQGQTDHDYRVTEKAMDLMEISSLRRRYVHSLSGGKGSVSSLPGPSPRRPPSCFWMSRRRSWI